MLTLPTGKVIKPRRTFVYGPGGIGKSTFAAQSPGCVFLPTEEGANDIEVAKFPICASWDQLMWCIGQLCTEQHQYRTVTIDTVDWAEKLVHSKVAAAHGVEQIGDIKYGRGYPLAAQMFRVLLQGLDWLRDNRGMGVILLAHAKVEKFDDPETASYDRYSPKLQDQVQNMIFEWADEVFFANYQTVVKEEDAGFKKTIVKGVGTGLRILRTTGKPAAKAKNRLGMPDQIPFSYDDYAKFLPH
ncbi:MAG: ATP-binding protein [Bacteroidota bacterium]|jgi:hypothetical protein